MVDYTKGLVKQRLNIHNVTNGGHGALICREGRGREILRRATMAESKKLKAQAATDFAILYMIAFRPEIKGE